MRQQGLFSPEPRAAARRTDPETSHEAADSVTRIRESQQAILDVLHTLGPLTDEELVIRYRGLPRQSPSGLRSRRDELVKKGKVRWTGDFRILQSGRRARVWEAV